MTENGSLSAEEVLVTVSVRAESPSFRKGARGVVAVARRTATTRTGYFFAVGGFAGLSKTSASMAS